MRHFLARRDDRLFANELCRQKSLGLIGELVGWKIRRIFGQIGFPARRQLGQTVVFERGDWEDLVEFSLVAVAVN